MNGSRFWRLVDRGVLKNRKASALGSRQGQSQLLGCVGIVVPLGTSQKKRQPDLGAGSKDLEG